MLMFYSDYAPYIIFVHEMTINDLHLNNFFLYMHEFPDRALLHLPPRLQYNRSIFRWNLYCII